jgi:hypothetical protein
MAFRMLAGRSGESDDAGLAAVIEYSGRSRLNPTFKYDAGIEPV